MSSLARHRAHLLHVVVLAALSLGAGAAHAVPPRPAAPHAWGGAAPTPASRISAADPTGWSTAAAPTAGAPAGWWTSAAPTAGATGRVTTPAAGSWPLRPLPVVVRRFEPPAQRWSAGHRGVDLAGRPGQRVLAVRAGTVRFAGRIAGKGVVVVGHGPTRTTYEPVAAAVTVGDRVAEGAVIGRLELLGSHCLPTACLHLGLLRGETYLDPLMLLGLQRVRLLPLRE